MQTGADPRGQATGGEVRPVERKLAAILAADVVGYSRLMERDEVGTLRALQRRRRILDGLIAEHRGRIFTTAGDSVLAEFSSAVDAVECAVAAQAAIARENAERGPKEPMQFRIGVHLGDIIVEGDNLFGDGINIAFRLQALARPGGICISNAVREQIGARLPVSLVDLGAQRVKNIAGPVRAFRIGGGPTLRLRLGSGRSIRFAAVVAAALLLVVGVGLWRLWPATAPAPAGVAASAGGRPGPARLSLVVLPFANLSDDSGQDYFAEGVTEDLTTDLSRLEGSLVIAASTALTYKGKPLDAKSIGRDLGVRYLVEGSVRRAGNRVRINAQLVDAATGAELWAERFDREMGELLQLQNEITARIARALQAQLAIAEAARPIAHPDALDYILRGRAQLTKPVSRENYAEAVRLFGQAQTLDPRSDAKTWLAAVLAVRALDELSATPDEDLRRAGQLADEALASDPNSALAHHVKGQVLRARGRFAEAIPEYQAAITLDRSRAPSYAHLGWCKFLTGDVEPAVADLEQAIRLSPHEPGIAAWEGRLGIIRLLEGDTDAAIAQLNEALSTNGRLPFVHAFLAAAYGLKGYTELGRAQLAVAQSLSQTYRSLKDVEKANWYDNPKIHAMAERTYFVGLRRAGMPGV